MTWAPVTVTEPATPSGVSATADPVLDQVPGELTSAGSRLSGISGRAAFSPSPLAGQAGGIRDARQQLASLLEGGAMALTVHPWTMAVAEPGGVDTPNRGWLSPDGASAALAAKLRDPMEPRKDNVRECLAVLVCAGGYQSFADTLAQLNTVLPLAGLPFAERRARQLASWERDKWQRAVAPANPRWQSRRHRQDDTAAGIRDNLGTLVATVEQYAADGDPVTELQALLAKRSARLAERRQAWADFRTALAGGTGWVVSLQGDPEQMARSLDGITPPSASCTLTALVALAGPAGSLDYFREVFGL
ncbi:hypothetical protein GCM10023116_12920 [Kistimonas scapharcae]|uniref:Uncharacterized protein n=1 Tax=Kistimonas scapharcae TaxID=1036133 RepID=A0ABP8UYL0_9GAMM